MKTNPNALINEPWNEEYEKQNIHGLTKRELFAAMALQGAESANVCLGGYEGLNVKETAERAVLLADALIVALNEDKGAK